jgi:hypothetical protein
MGISNSNMAFGYRLTPDLASQLPAMAPEARYSPTHSLPRAHRPHWGRRRRVAEHN